MTTLDRVSVHSQPEARPGLSEASRGSSSPSIAAGSSSSCASADLEVAVDGPLGFDSRPLTLPPGLKSVGPITIAGEYEVNPRLPLGMEYRAHRGADGRWDVHLWWAGDRRRYWWIYGVVSTEVELERTLGRRLSGVFDLMTRRDLRKVNTSRLKFLAADPLRGTTISYDAPIATITRADRWTPSAVTAANVALAQLGAGLTLACGARELSITCRVAGSSLVTTWYGVTESFIVPAVTPRAQGRPA